MNIAKEAEALSSYISEKRRYFHRHAELSFKESNTTDVLARELAALGYQVKLFSDYEGVLATLPNTKDRRTVLLRSDIDALPITEDTGADFASEHAGVMHACGHDCHMAMLLGAAKLLAAHKEALPGTVKLLFQSAEETGYGAKYYVEQGILDGISAALGLHMSPYIPKGTLNIENGSRMAACTNFRLVFHGEAAHGSTPHLGHDAIVAASAAVMNIQTAVSRMNNPLSPLVVTIGSVKAGKQFNIICDTVTMEGTIRSFDRDVTAKAPEWVKNIAEGTAKTLGCSAEFTPVSFEPAVINENDALTDLARHAAASLFGDDVLASQKPVMASEDFSLIMEKVPSVFCYLGAKEEGMDAPLHSSHFLPDDSVLYRGAALHAQFALDYFAKGGTEK